MCKSGPISGPDNIDMDNEISQLNNELRLIYGILGSHKSKRAINLIGKGMKFLFGTMDNDDAENIADVLQSVGNRQDKLHTLINGTVFIMKNLTTQWEFMRENQKMQLDNFMSLKQIVKDQYIHSEKVQMGLDYNFLANHIENLFLSIQTQIDKLKNAFLFLKSGIVDPYLVDPAEIIHSLTLDVINFNISFKDLDTLITQRKPVAIFDESSDEIHIIFTFPIVDVSTYNLYENFAIPKLFDKEIIAVNNIPKYFAINSDNSSYFSSDIVPCSQISIGYICKKIFTFDSNETRSCISDIFLNEDDSKCTYNSLKHSIDVYNIIDYGLVIFSSYGINIELRCANFSNFSILQGAHLLLPPFNCSLNSKMFTFKNTVSNRSFALTHFVPHISCCSKYFKINNSSKFNEHLILNSFHDIKTVSSDSVTSQINDWKLFGPVKFMGHLKTWHWSITCIICVLIVVLVTYKIFCPSVKRTENNIIIEYAAAPTPKPVINGYPSF